MPTVPPPPVGADHIELEWGVTQGYQAVQIGWGCPLNAPIQGITSSIGGDILGYINYFVPLSEFSAILAGWVVAVGAYYMASVILRWVKAVS